MGVLYEKYDLLEKLTTYKVRSAPQDPPGKFETGTGNSMGYVVSFFNRRLYSKLPVMLDNLKG